MKTWFAALSALFATAATLPAQAEPLAPGLYKLTPLTASVGFAIDNFWGVATTHGSFTALQGELVLAEPFAASKVSVAIETKSIETSNKKRDEHLRTADFLAAETYPTMTFQSSKVSGSAAAFTIDGALHLRDTTKPVTLKGSIDERSAEIHATATINRKDFGVNYDGMGLDDEVVIEVKVKPAAIAH